MEECISAKAASLQAVDLSGASQDVWCSCRAGTGFGMLFCRGWELVASLIWQMLPGADTKVLDGSEDPGRSCRAV